MTLTDAVERVLREHRWVTTHDDRLRCACGHVPEPSVAMETHRAAMVVAVTDMQLAQAVIDRLASGRILHLQPDDVVAVHLTGPHMSKEQAHHIAKTVKGVVGERQVLLVGPGCEVDGYRPVTA